MECVLMSKNRPVVDLVVDNDSAAIIQVLQTHQPEYLPVGIGMKDGIPNKRDLNDWWYGRAIPASRSGIREALEKLEIFHTEQLLTKCYGLSLSDQYWMKPMKSRLTWAAVNFFDNEFSEDIGDILFGQPVKGEIDFMSPCNTSDGWLKKKWKIVGGRRCLIKAGSSPYMQEPLNEVFATRLHERLGGEHVVPYTLLWEDNVPYSLCDNFVTADTELVSAVSINRAVKKRSQNSAYKHFMETCHVLGIPGMREFIDYMLVFDYIMANTDRHFGNFGALRNVETLEWIGPAPLYDSGTSLWHDKLTRAIYPLHEKEMKPFYTKASRQLELVTDFSWIPFKALQGLYRDVEEVFAQSEWMDEERIEVIGKAVEENVETLEQLAWKS